MITTLQKYCKWSLFAVMSLITINADAGHILGTDITYSYVSPNTYFVTVRWYRDCQGVPGSQQILICYSSVSAGVNNSVIFPRTPGVNFLPPFQYWPPMTTSCQGGSAPGIELIFYQGVITLPSSQTDWIISYSTFPANIGIGQNFMYVSTKIDNLNNMINSSSNYFWDPTFFYCLNQPALDNLACFDADGDSLSYHLIPALDNTTPCPPAPFVNPVPAYSPLQSSTPITMDSLTGALTFNPTQVGTSMVSARIDEFRNGILINSSTIEHLVLTVTGCVNLGVDEHVNSLLNIYPSPANDILMVEWYGDSSPIVIEAIDLSGKISNLMYNPNGEGTYELNVASLSQGIYTIRVTTENNTAIQRFLKNCSY